MVNNDIRFILFSAVKDGEALYSQSAKTRPGAETVAQIMNSLLSNSDLN